MWKVLDILGLVLLVSSISVFAQASDRDRGIELYRAGNFAEAVVVLQKWSKPIEKISLHVFIWAER